MTRTRLTVGILLVILVVAVVLGVLSQIGKWTCTPPDGVWVEGPDHCVELP